MKSMSMTITVWTPEDRNTREDMISWCQFAGIQLVEQRVDDRRLKFTFMQTPHTNNSSWQLLEAKLNFEDELQKARK